MTGQFGSITKSESQKEILALEIAIVGFWRMNSDSEYECYYSFKVTEPLKRDVKKQM